MRRGRVFHVEILILSLLLLSIPASAMDVKIYTPIDLYENSRGILLMKVYDRYNGTSISNVSNNISCFIRYPNGTMFINGSHPYEDAPGIYILNFTVAEVMGIYNCWVSIINETNFTIYDAGMFKVKWDVYENISRLYERIGSIIFLGHWERYNITEQTAYQLSKNLFVLQNISRTTEKASLTDTLRETALSQAINIIFWIIVLLAIGIISTMFITRRKRKKVYPGEIPATIAEKVITFAEGEESEEET